MCVLVVGVGAVTAQYQDKSLSHQQRGFGVTSFRNQDGSDLYDTGNQLANRAHTNQFGVTQVSSNHFGTNQFGRNRLRSNQFGTNQNQNQNLINQRRTTLFRNNQIGITQFGVNQNQQRGLNHFGTKQRRTNQFGSTQFQTRQFGANQYSNQQLGNAQFRSGNRFGGLQTEGGILSHTSLNDGSGQYSFQ